MNENGDNAYGVSFGRIMFLQKIIEGHDNVRSFERHSDLAFSVKRSAQSDTLEIVCVDEYTLSEAKAMEIIRDFPKLSVIFVGGKWNKPSREAEKYCRAKRVGVSNAGDINATLLKTKYWQ